MINKRLLHAFPQSMTYIKKNVLCQWIGLLGSTVLSGSIAFMIASVLAHQKISYGLILILMIGCIVIRILMNKAAVTAAFGPAKRSRSRCVRSSFPNLPRSDHPI